MTLDEVARELIEGLGSADDGTIGWEQVREWPSGAIEVFEKAGWIVAAAPATTVECPACEDNCYMPVHVLPARDNRPARAFVACDQNDYTGRVKIDMSHLRQWQITECQIAQWISRAVGLKGKPERNKSTGMWRLGALQGKKRVGSLEFSAANPVCVNVGDHSLPLKQIVDFEGRRLGIDRNAVVGLVDLPPVSQSKDREQSSARANEAQKRRSRTETMRGQADLDVGTAEWRRQTAMAAANARHGKPGGSRDKQEQIRRIWASGKYSSRDICAEQESAALGMSFKTARKALVNTPDPKKR